MLRFIYPMRLYAKDGQIYAGWIEFCEGRPYVRAFGGTLPIYLLRFVIPLMLHSPSPI